VGAKRLDTSHLAIAGRIAAQLGKPALNRAHAGVLRALTLNFALIYHGYLCPCGMLLLAAVR
jgi:hypothetical protein